MPRAFFIAVAIVAVAASELDFRAFETRFGRRYANDNERTTRGLIFESNLQAASRLQDMNPHATFGVTKFSDWTDGEYALYVSGSRRRETLMEMVRRPPAVGQRLQDIALNATDFRRRHAPEYVNITADSHLLLKATKFSRSCPSASPYTWDWRSHGVVTPVKDQGTCGSCWAFSATANVESVAAISGQPLQDLSEQELVSCVPGDAGCGGGSYVVAWRWLLATQGGGMTSNADYPYVSANGNVPSCPAGPYPIVARIQDYVVLPANDEANMAAIVAAKSPLSVGVDAIAWKQYTGGVMTTCPSAQIDHCVVIVGYDLSASQPYWIIKNSFGVDWGESGYIRLQYGQNTCLVSEYPATATVGAI